MLKTHTMRLGIGLVGCLSLACSKSGGSEGNTTQPAAYPPAQPTPSAKGGDLEAAMAAPGDKTVTAVGEKGDTQVLAVGGKTLAETDTYIVKVNVPDAAQAGQNATATISLEPKTGWKLNLEFPTKLTIKAPDGVKVAQATQGIADAAAFSEKAGSFKVSFTPEAQGTKNSAADFRFAVCTKTTCDPKEATLAWAVDVK